MLLPHRALALSRAASHLRLVHDVVVVERRQVHQLDDRARDGDLPGVGFRAELRGQHREQRAEALAAGLEQMLNGLGHQLVGLAQLGGHQLLDARHPVADVGGEHGVTEVHARDHGRWCLHCSNILGSVQRADVVVIGAGPAGSAAAAWASRNGRDVLVIDSAQFPRDKACGDGLTPRAVAELELLGLGPWLDGRIRHHGLRMSGFGADVEIAWPGPSFPPTSSAVPRTELDDRIRSVAVDDGAKMLLGVKAVGVQHDSSGRVASVTLDDGAEIGCSHLIVADGARSTLGRVLGADVASGDGVRRRDPRLHRLATQQRAMDHVAPGTALPRRRGAARLRLDLPARQRRGEHRRRRPGDGQAPRRRRAATVDVVLRRRFVAKSGASRRAPGRTVGAAADGRGGVGRRRAELDAHRRRRGVREPAQRRGHRLRTRDRATGRRVAGRRGSDRGVADRTAAPLRPRILRRPPAGVVADHPAVPARNRPHRNALSAF